MSKPSCTGCIEYEGQLDALNCEKDRWLVREKDLERAINELSSQCQSIQGKYSESQLDLAKANEELSKMSVLKNADVEWQRKLIILGEMYQKTREQLEAVTSNHFIKSNSKDSLQLKLDASKRELEDTRSTRDQRTRERDFFREKLKETEETNTRLMQEITDLRGCIDKMKTDHKAVSELKQRSIESLEKINDALIKKIEQLNQQLNRHPLILPSSESLNYEPEGESGEVDDLPDSTCHSNNHN